MLNLGRTGSASIIFVPFFPQVSKCNDPFTQFGSECNCFEDNTAYRGPCVGTRSTTQRGTCSRRGQHARSRARSTLGAPTGPGRSGGRGAPSRAAAPASSTDGPDSSPAPRTAFCQRTKVSLVKMDRIHMTSVGTRTSELALTTNANDTSVPPARNCADYVVPKST